jgi:hypothetical protein
MTVVQVRARVYSDATGAWTEIPILLTTEGPLSPLIDYLLMRSQERSQSWMRKVVQSVQLLLRIIDANESQFPDVHHLLNAFSRRLYSGTVGEDGIDPSGLYWKPMRSRTANMLLAGLSDYCRWITDHRDSHRSGPSWDEFLSRYEERMYRAAWEHKRSRAFLGHTWSLTPPTRGPVWLTSNRRSSKVADEEDAVSFPEGRLTDLLLQGFARRGYAHHPELGVLLNLRDSLIRHGWSRSAAFRNSRP